MAFIDELFADAKKNLKPPRKIPKYDLEGSVVRECLAFLRLRCPGVIYVERRNTGAVTFADGGFLRFGSKGAADIWFLLRQENNEPIHIEVECKRRDGKGRLTEGQIVFKRMCEDADIRHFVVTSAYDLEKQLRECYLT